MKSVQNLGSLPKTGWRQESMERLTISENRRYFVKETGEPFVWIADTVWTMPQRIKWDDVEYYMKTRKDQGFTVLQIVALDPERPFAIVTPCGAVFYDENGALVESTHYGM